MQIKATRIAAKTLLPGDLFSTADQDYWNKNVNGKHTNHSIGERVYIRTSEPCPAYQEDDLIYKIDIVYGN